MVVEWSQVEWRQVEWSQVDFKVIKVEWGITVAWAIQECIQAILVGYLLLKERRTAEAP